MLQGLSEPAKSADRLTYWPRYRSLYFGRFCCCEPVVSAHSTMDAHRCCLQRCWCAAAEALSPQGSIACRWLGRWIGGCRRASIHAHTRHANPCTGRYRLWSTSEEVFMPVDIAQLLAFAVKNNASDLHLSA